ncbi:hypothetical protein GQ53DRAFT_740380 [Thozetella sp. PMI_491]|nr:hypothetical protein GQ53DRAFT_740380 [Thozetella sp. PMI_491]
MLVAEKRGLPSTSDVTGSHLHTFFTASVQDSMSKGGEVIEAGNWAAAALWVPPSGSTYITPDNPERTPTAAAYIRQRDEWKQKYLSGRKFWMLHLIGRNPELQVSGAIRAVIDPYVEQARSGGFPIWLEATNDHAKDVYTHFGFRIVASTSVGDDTPYPSVTVYGMLFEP